MLQRILPLCALLRVFAQLDHNSRCHVGGMPITALITSTLNVAVDFLQGVGTFFDIMDEPVYIIYRPELTATYM